MTVPALADVFPALSQAIASLAAKTATPGAGFAQLFAALLGTEKDGETAPAEPNKKQQGDTTGAAEALAGAAAAAGAASIAPAPETAPAARGKAATTSTGPTSPSTASVESAPAVELASGAVETTSPVPDVAASPGPAVVPGARPAPPPKHVAPPAATGDAPPSGEPAAPGRTAGTNAAASALGPTSAVVGQETDGEEPQGTVVAGTSSTRAARGGREHAGAEGSRPVETQAAGAHVEKLALAGETAGSGDHARTGTEEGRAPAHAGGEEPLGSRHDGSATTPAPLEVPVSRETARTDAPRDARSDAPLARDVDRLLGLEKARPLAVRDGGEMRLEVSPEGLGRIEMHVAVRADGVNASLYAAHDHARETLEAHRASLAAALGRSNLRLEGFTVGLGQERRDPEPRRDEARAAGATPATGSSVSTLPAPAIDAGAPAGGLSLRA